MRTIVISIENSDGKSVSSRFKISAGGMLALDFWDELAQLSHRLDVLERDGPWNNGEPSQGKEGPAIFHERVVQNSLQPAPEEQSKA